VREVVSLGRNARATGNIKVRQPINEVNIVVHSHEKWQWIASHGQLITDELNSKSIIVSSEDEEDKYVSYSAAPNFKLLGPRLGKDLPLLKQVLADAGTERLKGILAQRAMTGKATIELPNGKSVVLDEEDIEIRLKAKDGWVAAQGNDCVVVISTELSPELLAEGVARDIVRLIQERRKELGLQFTDRIQVGIQTDSAFVRDAIVNWTEYIKTEVLSVQLGCESNDVPIAISAFSDVEPATSKVSDHVVTIYVRAVK
jgi:isoleucyl-tRNA synthetase